MQYFIIEGEITNSYYNKMKTDFHFYLFNCKLFLVKSHIFYNNTLSCPSTGRTMNKLPPSMYRVHIIYRLFIIIIY